jgi:hypothetical protein
MSETTKTLQRWDCIMDGGEGARFADMDKDDNGGWVSYDDAEKLLAEVERLREENLKLRRTNEKLVSNIGGMLIRANNEVARLREALQSIAKSTCCDRCNEAALVARNALKEDGR